MAADGSRKKRASGLFIADVGVGAAAASTGVASDEVCSVIGGSSLFVIGSKRDATRWPVAPRIEPAAEGRLVTGVLQM